MKTDHLFNRYYFGRPEFVYGTTQFHELLAAHIKSGFSVLEFGAGPQNLTTNFLATLGPVAGADISREVYNNSSLSEAHTFDGLHLPFPNDTFDACVSNWVTPTLDFA
jgi:Methyltransferase domain